jgi:hypothetical protein
VEVILGAIISIGIGVNPYCSEKNQCYSFGMKISNDFREAEISCAMRLRKAAIELVATYDDNYPDGGSVLGLLAKALEDEAIAQKYDLSKLKFFYSEDQQ